MHTRTRSAILVAALAAASVLFIGTPGAIATQGQSVLAGMQNTAASSTIVVNETYVPASECHPSDSAVGLVACGLLGVWGLSPSSFGVGIEGDAIGSNGIGVGGYAHGSNGVGVWGFSAKGDGIEALTRATNRSALFAHHDGSDPGYGVFARANVGTGISGGSSSGDGIEGVTSTLDKSAVWAHHDGSSSGWGVHANAQVGTGVHAEGSLYGLYGVTTTASGTGVRAVNSAPGGTALRVDGKASFSRSGITTIAAGTASMTISLAGVSTSSMVVATAQQNGDVFVKAAVPAGGSFKLFLSGNAPAGGLKVAYFVLN